MSLATGYDNPVLTLHELSKRVPYQYDWLIAQTRLPDREDRLPSIKRGKKQEVIYSEFLAWLDRMYGPDGKRRGQEDFGDAIEARMNAARKVM
jgi:hypothetical protein